VNTIQTGFSISGQPNSEDGIHDTPNIVMFLYQIEFNQFLLRLTREVFPYRRGENTTTFARFVACRLRSLNASARLQNGESGAMTRIVNGLGISATFIKDNY
jgi:hypothetical protein